MIQNKFKTIEKLHLNYDQKTATNSVYSTSKDFSDCLL